MSQHRSFSNVAEWLKDHSESSLVLSSRSYHTEHYHTRRVQVVPIELVHPVIIM